MNDSIRIEKTGWIARVQKPTALKPGRLVVLFHGWTGDEESMGVIARKFPEDTWLISPRAPNPAPDGGYSWLPPGGGLHSTITDYLPGIDSFLEWLDMLVEIKPAITPFNLAGFSQGGAAAYALALAHPERIHKLSGLAAFLPKAAEEYIAREPLAGKGVFIAHGRQDERIRIEAGYEAAAALTRAGADVNFCAADTGHKLSTDCHRRLVSFFSEESTSPDN